MLYFVMFLSFYFAWFESNRCIQSCPNFRKAYELLMVQINWFWRWFWTLSLMARWRFAACGPSASAGAASEAQVNHNLCFGCCSCGRSRTTNSEMSSVFSCSNVENVCRHLQASQAFDTELPLFQEQWLQRSSTN